MKNYYFYKQFLKIAEFLPKIKSSINIKPLGEEEKLMGIERRKFKRVLFTIEDGIIGSFSPPGGEKKDVAARVMNISEGGVQLRFKPILNNRIKVGDRLLLTEIRGKDSEQVIVNVDAEVKWVSDDKFTNDIGLGLEFVDVFDKSNTLNEFVEFWYMQRLEN